MLLLKTVTYIGFNAFYGTAWYNAQSDGIIYINNVLYKCKGDGTENVTVKSGTVNITDEAFSGCKNLKTVSIPDSTEKIGWYAFGWCDNLTSINLGKNVSEIVYGAFSGCNSLKNISLPNKVEKIERSTFSYCSSLETVDMTKNVKEIEWGAFSETNLKEVNFVGTQKEWESIKIGNFNEPLLKAKINYLDFTDVKKEDWFFDAVKYVKGKNYISGYGGTSLFGAGDNIQRQDFVVILARMVGADLTPYQKASKMTDVPTGASVSATV